MNETEPGLPVLSHSLHVMQVLCVCRVLLRSGSACDLKMAACYMRHLSEPMFGLTASSVMRSLLHAQALRTVVPETMPGAVSLRRSASVCVLYAAALCGWD